MRDEEEEDGLWPEHQPAVEAFIAVQDQWRVVAGFGGAFWLGLDHAACEASLRLAGIAVTPALWAELRVIETGVKAVLNGS
ncbi:MAG TPA: hypothetical protein DD444_15410 [Citreicella sp.]|nr:hypothetical protein [Citreicella sp.]